MDGTEQVISEIENVMGVSTYVKQYLNQLPTKLLSIGIRVLLCVLAFWIGTRIIKMLLKLLRKSMEHAGAESGVISFVISCSKAALHLILVFILLSYFGIDTASIVALVGSGGIAIGLAVQGSLSNFAGGVLILLLKPFKVGDYIKEDGHGNEGTVTEIQIFYTKLTTVDNKVVVLPNGNLANSSLTNVTANPTRRLDISVGISYDSDVKLAKAALLSMLKGNEYVLKNPEPIVFVDDLADSAVVLNLRFHVSGEKYWDAKWDVTEKIKLTLDENGISIPFPQVDVHLEK